MVVVYCASAMYALATSARLKSLLTLLATTGLFLTLIYAYVYPFGYPMMNGLMFEQVHMEASTLVLRGVLDLATVAIVTLLTILAICRLGTRRILVGIALVNVSLILASGVSAARNTAQYGGHADAAAVSVAQPIRYAKGKNNVLVLFLDRFMGAFVEGILRQEPQLAEVLDGFTWYPRTVAPGENSIAGVHAMLGGYDYTPRQMNARERLLRDLSVESYAILPYNFTRKGYEANLVSPRGLGFTMEGDCSFLDDIEGLNCTHIPAWVTKELAEQHNVPMQVLADSLYTDLLVLLGLMRGMPYVMRAVLHERGPWRPFLDHSAGTTFKQWAELKSLPKLSTASAERGNLNVVFNMLPHEPYFMGEDCVPRSEPLEAPPGAAAQGHVSTFAFQHFVAARCALLLVGEYMKWMREARVYDNTKIVVVSDHGIVGPVEDHSSRAVEGGTTQNTFVRSRSLLLVKERNAHGPLRVSEEFLPNAETPRIVCEEIGGCVNPYLDNKPVEALGRDDPFYVDFVPWQFSLQEPTRFIIRGAMVLEGRDPYKASSWREVEP